MKIDIDTIKKGLFIKTHTINPHCGDYGPLMVTGVKITTEKYNTNWDEFRLSKPSDYINRQTIHIQYVNQSGKEDVLHYWLDEFTNPNSSFPDMSILTANNWKTAKRECLKIDARNELDRVYKSLKLELKAHYKTISKYAPVLKGEHTEIEAKIDELIELL